MEGKENMGMEGDGSLFSEGYNKRNWATESKGTSARFLQK